MIKILHPSTDLARSVDTLSTLQESALAAELINEFGGKAIYVRYWGGRSYVWFVAKTIRAFEKWKSDNDFVGQNADAFRLYCDPIITYFLENKEVTCGYRKFSSLADYYKWRREVFA